MLESLQKTFDNIIGYGILFLEVTGSVLIMWNAVHALVLLIRGDKRGSRVTMAEGINLGLSFLLGSEVLTTLIAPDWRAIGMTCVILVMRAGVNILLHFEHKFEKAAEMEEAEERAEEARRQLEAGEENPEKKAAEVPKD